MHNLPSQRLMLKLLDIKKLAYLFTSDQGRLVESACYLISQHFRAVKEPCLFSLIYRWVLEKPFKQ